MEDLRCVLKLLLLIWFIPIAHLASNQSGLRVSLKRRDNEDSRLNPHERWQAGVERSKKRARYLATKSSAEIPIHPEFNGEFLVEIQVGSPAVKFEALADLGSDLVWFQCRPCNPCLNESIPIFDPSKSSTYSPLSCQDTFCNYIGHSCTGNSDCSYTYNYAVSYTTGVLSSDTFALGDAKVDAITFGCGHINEKFGYVGGGFVGLGRGPLSMVKQLGSKLGAAKFSYCLPSLKLSSTVSSPMVFGQSAGFSGVQPISLAPNPASPTFWYVPVIGFSVAGKPVDIPAGTFDINPNGSGGMFIDTGVTIMLLYQAAYDPIVKAIKAATNLPPVDGKAETGNDLCYSASSTDLKVAPLGIIFKGGAELVLPVDNYFVKAGPLANYLCFAAAVTTEAFSVMGNIAQQNIHFLFDLDSYTFAFRHEKCDSL